MARTRTLMSRGLTVREAAARLRIGKTALYEALHAVASGRAETDVTTHP